MTVDKNVKRNLQNEPVKKRLAWLRTEEGCAFVYDDPLPERRQRREDMLNLFNQLNARDQTIVLRLVQALSGD